VQVQEQEHVPSSVAPVENLPPSSSPTPRVPRRTSTVCVIEAHEAQEDDQISLKYGEYITDIEQLDDGWWRGTTANGKRGLFPASCVEECTAHSEAEVSPPVPTTRVSPEPGTSGG
jgi:hypothetical protein